MRKPRSRSENVVASTLVLPSLDIGRVVFSGLRRQIEVSGQEGRAELRDKLFDGIAFIAPSLAPEIPVKARWVPRPVAALVRERCVVGFGVAERLERGHLHPVIGDAVVSLIAAMPDGGPCRGEERFGLLDALHGVKTRLRLRIETLGQAVDLVHAKDGVAFEEGDFALGFLARVLIDFRFADAVGIDDQAAVLALSHKPAEFLRLPERHPDRRGETFRDGLAPEHQHVDPLIRQTVEPQRPRNAPCRVLRVPRLQPWPDALLQIGHNSIGDALINILLHCPALLWPAGCACNPTSHAAMSGGPAVTGRTRGKGDHPSWQGAQRPKDGERPASAPSGAWP